MAYNKRGQAALEFLMTYGWAILVVLVVIGALAYFGVLNPDSLVPDKCTLSTGISCDDFMIENNKITIKLGNGLGRRVKISRVEAKQIGGGADCINTTETTLDNSELATLELAKSSCSITDTGRKPKFKLNVTYTYADSSLAHVSTGELMGTIQ